MKRNLFCLVLAIVSFSTFAQWSTDPYENNLLTPTEKDLYSTEVEVNEDGVTYIFYNMGGGTGSTHYYLQILDKDGIALYPEGKMISDYDTKSWTAVNDYLSLDKDGNAIYIVEDRRYSQVGNYCYTAYKISPTGKMLWGDDGIRLSNDTYGGLACVNNVILDDNSIIFAWYVYGGESSGEIIMNRLSADGEYLWDEPVVLGEVNVNYSYPYLVDAGNNQFHLMYAKGTNQDLMLRKIDFDGEQVWAEDVKVYRGGFGSIPIWTFLQIIPDGEGGVFIGWHDDRFFTNYESIHVSRILADGSYGFVSGEGGEQISFSSDIGLRSGQPKMVLDKANNALYVVWREFDANYQTWSRIMTQKLDMQGQLLWGMEGKEVLPLENRSISYHSAQLGEDGQFAVFYMIYFEYIDQRAYAILLDGKNAAQLWDEHLDLSTNYCTKSNLLSTPLNDGKYWFTYWKDERNGSSQLYGQRVFLDGTFSDSDVIIPTVGKEPAAFSVYPSVIDSKATFAFENKTSGQVNISLYSLAGQKMANIYAGILAQGKHTIDWNVKGLVSGTYIAVVQTGTSRLSQKVIIK